jgi:hypothetical protein
MRRCDGTISPGLAAEHAYAVCFGSALTHLLDVAHDGARGHVRVLAMISCSGTFWSPRWLAAE